MKNRKFKKLNVSDHVPNVQGRLTLQTSLQHRNTLS